jgi:spermidine/putrescine transport system ATP-binding protein
MPGELSGGQRQRVAIARAVIQRPKVLLLDEPLGALDLQLRRLMQTELKKLQQQLGITFVYITHDQEEALTMSDRIAVMRDGRLEQTGTAAEVYDRPQTSYVARFVGNANLLGGTVTGRDGGIVSFSCHGAEVKTDASGVGRDYERGDQITVAVRAESIDIFHDGSNGGMPVLVTGKSFAGGMLRITMSPVARSGHTPPKEAVPEERGGEGPAEIVAGRYGVDSPFSPGQNAWINWPPERAVPVDVAKTSDKAVGRQRGSLKPEGAGSSWAAAGERARREAALAGVGKK